MGLVTTTKLVCDRCGASVALGKDRLTPFEIRDEHPDWHMVNEKIFLCPDCAQGYELLLARHKVELDDYIKGA